MKRRAFLGMAGVAWAGQMPKVTNPRATSGDPVGPQWAQQLTITVGPSKADLVGTSDRVLQAAVDYVAGIGGGTVRILPGTYTVRNSVFLRSGVRVLGSGAESIIFKAPSVKAKLSADSDWFDQEITIADPRGIQIGDGICLITKNPHNGGKQVLKRTLVARNGNRFRLNKPLRENFWLMGDSTASTLYPVLSGENISDVAIENIALDGNRANNENLDGNYAGCIWMQDCNKIQIRNVEARNNNGDGISWQICHDVTVENCHSHDHAGLGFHPGSGSQRSYIANNRSERNDIGIFFCWGVKYSLAETNKVYDNRLGVSIGHRDTDNVVRANEILRSKESGVLFRPERGRDFAGHRNLIEGNTIVDSGGDAGIAVDVQGQTEAVKIVKNQIRETRQPGKRVGVRLGADTKDITLAENRIDGVAIPVSDLRKRT